VTTGSGGRALSVAGGRPLAGSLQVPGDKSVSHRALLLGALAEGESTIVGLSDGDDVRRTASAIQAIGAEIKRVDRSTLVHGGRSRLGVPPGPIDLGNSGTGMRLLIGVLAGVAGVTVLTGDRSLSERPMDRVADPLGRMGAHVVGRGRRCFPPVEVTGGRLHGIEYTPPMASAQVKAAVLLAGLDADGDTIVNEPVVTRTHTEDMLATMGAEITIETTSDHRVIRLLRSSLRPTTITVPGDPSQAAFWIVGATMIPDSTVSVSNIYLGPERTGFIGVLRRMGAAIDVHQDDEHTGTVITRTSSLVGTTVRAEEIPSLDEVPILAIAAAAAAGETRFCDVAELRVKESDRLAATADLVHAFGGAAEVDGDDLVVNGRPGAFRAGTVDSHGDHRMAMAAAIAGIACAGGGAPTVISGWDAVETSYPAFEADLIRLTESR
jgi:3-phosphoshikimate 1-carboxyvinyltransferase